MATRVYLVEDHEDMRFILRRLINRKLPSVEIVGEVDRAERALAEIPVLRPEVVLIDISLPGMDGLEVCRKLREEARKGTPILMLTARDQLDDKLAGFESGADDYLVKPFELREVEARLEVLKRRGQRIKPRELKVADLEYNLETYTVRRAGKKLDLNPIGLKLLEKLMGASPAVVTRRELENHVWGEELPDSDSLRVHIHTLRAAIDKPFDVALINTRHGIGYCLAPPDEVSPSA